MTTAHNHLARVGGFAPAEWAFGRQVDDLDNLAIHTSEATSDHAMSENLQLRLRAEKRYLELQARASRAKISRALNRAKESHLFAFFQETWFSTSASRCLQISQHTSWYINLDYESADGMALAGSLQVKHESKKKELGGLLPRRFGWWLKAE